MAELWVTGKEQGDQVPNSRLTLLSKRDLGFAFFPSFLPQQEYTGFDFVFISLKAWNLCLHLSLAEHIWQFEFAWPPPPPTKTKGCPLQEYGIWICVHLSTSMHGMHFPWSISLPQVYMALEFAFPHACTDKKQKEVEKILILVTSNHESC